MLHEGLENYGGDEDDSDSNHRQELDLLEQLNNLSLVEDTYRPSLQQKIDETTEPTDLKEATKGWLNPNSPIFSKDQASSKVIKYNPTCTLLKHKNIVFSTTLCV